MINSYRYTVKLKFCNTQNNTQCQFQVLLNAKANTEVSFSILVAFFKTDKTFNKEIIYKIVDRNRPF